MALPTVKTLMLGNLKVAIYDFAGVGDVLPLHDHDDTTAHITIVCSGSLAVSGPGWQQTNGARDVLDFAAGNPHQFEALQPNTRIVNIVKAMS